MTTTIDALVEALEHCVKGLDKCRDWPGAYEECSKALHSATAALALARAEQAEPVGHLHVIGRLHDYWSAIPAFNLPDGKHAIYTTPPAAPAKLEPWMVHARKLTQWRHCMSYNDSYFGESPGLLKHITAELERLLPEEPLEAAHNAKLGGADGIKPPEQGGATGKVPPTGETT